MRVLLSPCGSRGDVEPMGGLAAQSRAPGAAVPVSAPPDFVEPPDRFGVPLVPSAGEGCHAPVATGVIPTGGQR